MGSMTTTSLLLLFMSVVAYRPTSAYPTGTPNVACASMMPSHNNTASLSPPAPYSIVVSTNNCYTPGQPITVTLKSTGNTTFSGFLTQARKPNDPTTSYGTFNASLNSNVQTLSCFSGSANAMTHTNGDNDLTTTQFQWTAPASLTGSIVLTATVVKDFEDFWVQGVNLTLTACTTSGSPDTRVKSTASALLTAVVVCLLVSAFVRRRC